MDDNKHTDESATRCFLAGEGATQRFRDIFYSGPHDLTLLELRLKVDEAVYT